MAGRGRPRKPSREKPASPPPLNFLSKVVDEDMEKSGEMTDRERKSSNASKLRWARFAESYFEVGNATEAYKMAGYAVTTEASAATGGSRLLNEPWIQAYLMRLHAGDGKLEPVVKVSDEDKEILIADEDEILMILTQQMRDPKLGSKSRLEAAKELAKIKGMYTEKIALTSTEGVDEAIKAALGLDDEDDEE